jgi:microcystin-dependent protein
MTAKISIEPLPIVPPELLNLRDAMQRELFKLQDYVNTRSVPVGLVAVVPRLGVLDGWLVCDGSAFDTVQYRDLYDYLGSGNLPNYSGRVIVGLDGTQLEFDTMDEAGGSANAVVVTHNHTQNSHGHGADDNFIGDHGHTVNAHNHGGGTGIHAHWVDGHWLEDGGGDVPGTNRWRRANGANVNNPNTNSVGVATANESPGTNGAGGHHHDITVNGSTATNQAAGVSGAGANLPPYRVANWMIKT